MTVTYTGVSQNLNATNVIYSNNAAVKGIVQAAMISMAEGNIEMLLDLPEDYKTKEDVERVFQGLHEQATDLIEDMIENLKRNLLAELQVKCYTARVKALHYDNNGELEDVTVGIDFT
jgi:Zn-dependent M32 family carboxypeptidase